MRQAHLSDSLALTASVERRLGQGETPITVTWLNHFSARKSSAELLRRFDYIGVDGVFLKWLIGSKARTSADMVLPLLLPRLTDARILAIGGRRADGLPDGGRASTLAHALDELVGDGSRVIDVMDGFDGLLRREDLVERIDALGCDVVLVGLGAGLQDAVALEAADARGIRVVLTCGGFLDQLGVPNYYPGWAYPLRLNWLVRLAREPRRLWRRYTIDAMSALAHRSRLRRIVDLPGYAAAEQAALDGDRTLV